MERDMDLVRKILEHAEELEHGVCAIPEEGDSDFPGYELATLAMHVRLVRSMGWMVVTNAPEAITELTWSGHDSLEQLRSSPPYLG